MVKTHILWGGDFIVYHHPRVDHLFRHIRYYHDFYERDLLDAINDVLVRKGLMNKAIAVDIGAHTGNHSLFLSKYCKEVHSFEPGSEAVQFFKMNMAGRPNVCLYNVAIGKERCIGDLINPDPGEAYLSYIDTQPKMMRENPVGVYPLDYYRLSPDLIKIDVEGGELNVLVGAAGTILNNLPELFIECRSEGEFDSVYEYVECWGYKPVKKYAFTPVWHFTAGDL